MDPRIALSVLAAAVMGFFGILMLMPEEPEEGEPRLPWLVSTDAQGCTRVFGFTIGETTLAEVQEVFGEEGKINLFVHPDTGDRYAAEAYFEQIYLSRLRADFVVSLDLDQPSLDAMYQRGLRISQLASGDKKVALDPEDLDRVTRAPIRSIAYLPWKSLDADIIERRFGPAALILTEKSGVTHWLYPDKGMDIALDTRGGVVIQYVNPEAFWELVAPLDAQQRASKRPEGM